jgi:class 3 adenylate cyclase
MFRWPALSSKTSAGDIVEMLNGLFSRFDDLAQQLGIEKIKTIGDCYMPYAACLSRAPIMRLEWRGWRWR